MKQIFNDTQISGELCIIKEMLLPAGNNQEVPHARVLKRVIALEKRLLELNENYEIIRKRSV